jgi:hypothetical protein
MRTRTRVAAVMSLAVVAGCGSDGLPCGDGTVVVDGECVPDPGAGLPPTLTSATSDTPFVSGGVLVLEGTGFTGAAGGTLRLFVDDEEQPVLIVESDTRAVATLPPATGRTAELRLENDLGEASLEFTYQGLLGSAGTFRRNGSLLLVDPRTGEAAEIGPLRSEEGRHSISGMAFAPDGTLYASEVGSQQEAPPKGDVGARLLTIDPETGEVTIGPTFISPAPPPLLEDVGPKLPDLAFIDDQLFAWSEDGDLLVEIDVATGQLTGVETDVDSYGSGLEFFEGALLGTFNDNILSTLDPATGEVSSELAFEEVPAGRLIASALTVYQGKLVGTNGYYGAGLVTIDPAAETFTTTPGGTSLDALVAMPDDVAARTAPPRSPGGADLAAYAARYASLAPTRPAAPAAIRAPLSAQATLTRYDAVPDARGRLALDARQVTRGGLHVVSPDGELTLSAADLAAGYQLVSNQRDQLKLLAPDGRPVARRISILEGV